jgi:hypothetical protein
VLDYLTSTITSTHILTGTSATLLLSHLNVPSDMPALLGFVNDMLMSMYLPKLRNNVASMWLICTAMRVVDMCPIKRLCEVIGSLQDGLSVWVVDQHQVLTRKRLMWVVFIPSFHQLN